MKYGWIPSLPDLRDQVLKLLGKELPNSIDLRPDMPEVYDQGDLGSCTGNAIAAAIHYDQKKNGNKFIFAPSRLFIYYQERSLEGSIMSDSGAQIRDGIKACASVGVCPESRWAYDTSFFSANPPAVAYHSASQHKITNYSSVPQHLTTMQEALVRGYPIVIGFTVYDSFESINVAQTGNVPMPTATESVQGGHAVLVCGYDNTRQVFIVRNSWGPDWGDKGYFYMPYAYLTNPSLATDFWVINTTN